MSIPTEFTISFSDKPNIQKALMENPALVKEVIGTFVALMEESFDTSKGVQWAHLPKLLHKNLTFSSLVRGILRGSLDVKGIDAEAFDALGVEVHPFAMLSPRKNILDPSKVRTYDWRAHWRAEADEIGEELVTELVRKMFRYTRWVRIDEFAKALDSSQVATFRGLGQIAIENLPFVPALNYQKEHFGDLHVGKRMLNSGFFDCGIEDENGFSECPACKSIDTFHQLEDEIGCLSCNAGFTVKEL